MSRWGIVAMVCALVASACGSPPELVRTSYRAVYQITTDGTPTVEERLIRRPYEARSILTREGRIVGGTLTNDEGKWIYSTGSVPGWVLLGSGPHRATPDPRPLSILASAEEAGLFAELGSDEVADHPCRELRFGAGSDEELDAPTESDFADLCVHDSGVVLRERRVIGGETVKLIEASSFEMQPDIEPDAFVASEQTSTFGADPSADPAEVLQEAEERLSVELDPPGGFAYDGPSAKLVIGGSFGGDVGSAIVQRFVDGDELLELDHDPPQRRGGPATQVVSIEGRGQATLTLSLQVSAVDVPLGAVDVPLGAVDVPLGEGRSVRLLGADPQVLLEAAARLDAG